MAGTAHHPESPLYPAGFAVLLVSIVTLVYTLFGKFLGQ